MDARMDERIGEDFVPRRQVFATAFDYAPAL